MTWMDVLNYLWLNRWEITIICILLYYRKHVYKEYIFTPLAGGNGKIQMDEMAKAVLLIMIAKASEKEGRSPEQVYPDIYWIMLFTAVCTIAALKVPINKILGNYKKPSTSTETL